MSHSSGNFRLACLRNQAAAWTLLVIFLWTLLPTVGLAQQPTATIDSLTGLVLVNGQEQDTGTVLSAGDVVETRAGASAVLALSDGSLLELGENTKLDLAVLSQAPTGGRVSRVKLLWGRVRAALSPDHQQADSSFDISTPNAIIGVKFSQPDVEVSYDPAKQETVALALTVALAVKNLITDEEKVIPVGAIAIITMLGIEVITGSAAADIIVGSSEPINATEAAVAAVTATAAAEAATVGTATTDGIGTGTMIAIGVGAAAAVGGVVALAASDSSSDETETFSFTGTFRRVQLPTSPAMGTIEDTWRLTQTGDSISGTFSSAFTHVSCNYSYQRNVTGTVTRANTAMLTRSAITYDECGLPISLSESTTPCTLQNNGNTLNCEFSWGVWEYQRQ